MTNPLARALRDCLHFIECVPTDAQLASSCPEHLTGREAFTNGRAILAEHETATAPHPAVAFARYCEQRRDAASGPHDREFWHRQRGAALKAATL